MLFPYQLSMMYLAISTLFASRSRNWNCHCVSKRGGFLVCSMQYYFPLCFRVLYLGSCIHAENCFSAPLFLSHSSSKNKGCAWIVVASIRRLLLSHSWSKNNLFKHFPGGKRKEFVGGFPHQCMKRGTTQQQLSQMKGFIFALRFYFESIRFEA